MEVNCFIVLDVFLYIPRLVLVFQDVSVIYEHQDLLHSQMFGFQTAVFILVLLVLPFGIWVAQTIYQYVVFVFHTVAHLPCIISLCFFSSLHIVLYIAFCYLSLPAKYLNGIWLELLFSQVYFAAVLCFRFITLFIWIYILCKPV